MLRRVRALLVSAGFVCFLYAAGQFPEAAQYIGHLLTWGLPALWLLYCVGRWMDIEQCFDSKSAGRYVNGIRFVLIVRSPF